MNTYQSIIIQVEKIQWLNSLTNIISPKNLI